MWQFFSWTNRSIDRNLILQKYEPLQPFFLLSLAKRLNSEIFFDVGANIGAYTLLLSTLSNMRSAYAIEASAEAFSELQNNVHLNHLQYFIECLNFAASDSNGFADFGIVSSVSGANAILSTSIHAPEKIIKHIQIPTRRLDSAFDFREKQICLKIDTEGHEKNVLYGAKNLLVQNEWIIQIENYESNEAAALLLEYGGEKVARIGPDEYFYKGSCPFSDSVSIMEAWEEAAEWAVQWSRSGGFERPRPAAAKRRILPDVTVEASGRTLRYLRALKALQPAWNRKAIRTDQPTDTPSCRPSSMFQNSDYYWRDRYGAGGTSGAGSYGRLAQFKADVVNRFIADHSITDAIEHGCGDGAQLELYNIEQYLGLDISPEAIALCRQRFAGDHSKIFLLNSEWHEKEKFTLSLSIDVIYHLVEDVIFHGYMQRLFGSAKNFVCIYSGNFDAQPSAQHVRHRRFARWIPENAPAWALTKIVPNAYPADPSNPDQTSHAEFYFYTYQGEGHDRPVNP